MFKLGRGGGAGRGNGKRPLAPPSSATLHRPATAPGGRAPVGASPAAARGRPGGNPAALSAPAREETFSLESGRAPLDFGAIIRLTPDIVDEIKRVEAQGGVARIKFDPNLSNSSGNVIDVGGKEFRFTWSRELGDLCDIYEEHQSGEDGHGLLVENGSAWRKLTVHRILDESTKNHVKMRSEEAERLSKSRKAIILDPANPSVKNQAKSMAAAAVEGSMRRGSWKNKEFLKKRKVDSNQASNIGPSRSVFKSATASNNTKSRPSVSPLPSPPEQHIPGTTVSSIISTLSKGDSHYDDNIAPSNINKEEIGNFEKEIPSRVLSGVKPKASGLGGQTGDQSLNLRRFLITLLSENPKGMSLKALEKAAGETMPNSVKKIESIIKHIAIYQAPGKYVLKPSVETESSNQQAPESGSSPESSHDHTSAIEIMHVERVTDEKLEQQSNSDLNLEEELDIIGNIDTVGSSQEHFASDVKASNDNQGQACSSSDSGSDSDSDSESSGSGSDSGSQSRASSSDSDSDGSSSSKEGSDVDVDIMSSDNEKEVVVHKSMEPETILSSSPQAQTAYHDEHERNDDRIDLEVQVSSPAIDLNDSERIDEMTEMDDPSKNVPPNRSIEVIENPETVNVRISEKVSTPPYHEMGMQPERQQISFGKYSMNDVNEKVLKSNNNERRTISKDRFSRDLSENSGKPVKQKSKRTSNSEFSEGRSEGVKKAKNASSAPRNIEDRTFLSNVQHESPEQQKHVGYKEHVMQSESILLGEKNADSDSQEQSPAMNGRSFASGSLHRMHPSPDFSSGLDAEHFGSKTGDLNKKKGSEAMEKPNRYVEKNGNRYADTSRDNLHAREHSSNSKDKMQKDIRNINSDVKERYVAKNVGELGGDKHLAFRESCPTKGTEHFGTGKFNGLQSGKQKFDAEKSLVVGSKGHLLRRELSDLELGELRETPREGEESLEVKKQLDKKSSIRVLANMVSYDDANLEINKGRSSTSSGVEISKGRASMNASRGSKNQSPPSPRGAGQGNHGLHRKEPADSFSDSAQPAKPQQRAILSQSEQLPRLDHADSEAACWDMSAETTGRIEKRMSQRISQDNHSGPYSKNHASFPLQFDNVNGGHRNGELVQKSNALEQRKNNVGMVKDANMRDSSSDDDNSFYLKYDKDEPDLKGPIKDFSQYKQYIQEFREKYEVYCYLNKKLEKIRNDFLQAGNDLEIAQERDVKEYYNVVDKLREMYYQCGERNKQMKKVFILLHEELKNLKQRIKRFAEDYKNE